MLHMIALPLLSLHHKSRPLYSPPVSCPSQYKEDEDVVTLNTVLSLKDPLTGARIKTPTRFVGTSGLVSFDLDAFLSVAERTRKWQCPHRYDHRYHRHALVCSGPCFVFFQCYFAYLLRLFVRDFVNNI